jgi:methionine synthase I (cobalamin-dependent)
MFVMGSISTHPPNFKAAVKAANNLESEVGVDVVNATALSLWPSTDEELGNFMSQAQALKEGGVDAIALEMVKDLYHGKLVLKAAFATGLPVALGVTIKIHADGLAYIRDEDILLVDALKQYLEVCPNIVCINIMHSPAEFISTGLEAVRTVWDGTMGCYPNNGTPESWPEWTKGDLQPEDLVKFAAGWAAQGATLIGGCCGIGPAHIRALSQHFQKPSIFAPSL